MSKWIFVTAWLPFVLSAQMALAQQCEPVPADEISTLIGVVSDTEPPYRSFDDEEELRGQIDHDKLDELSGIVVGRVNPHVLWVHNDGPADNGKKKPKVYAVNREGEILGRAELPKDVKTDDTDFEDIAMGPCPWDKTRSCIYLADTGDNEAERDPDDGRKKVRLMVFEEPSIPVDSQDDPVEIDVEPKVYEFEYPDHPRDSEALAVAPSGVVVLLTKDQRGDDHSRTRLFALPQLIEGERMEAFRIGSLYSAPRRSGRPHDDFKAQVTGADLTPDGRTLIVRTRQFVTTFDVTEIVAQAELPSAHSGLLDAVAVGALTALRDDDDSRKSVLKNVKGTRVRINRGLEAQGEAIAYDPVEHGFWTVSELNPILYFFKETTPGVAVTEPQED